MLNIFYKKIRMREYRGIIIGIIVFAVAIQLFGGLW